MAHSVRQNNGYLADDVGTRLSREASAIAERRLRQVVPPCGAILRLLT